MWNTAILIYFGTNWNSVSNQVAPYTSIQYWPVTANAEVKDILRKILYLIFSPTHWEKMKRRQQKSFVLFVRCQCLLLKSPGRAECVLGLACSRAHAMCWACSEQQIHINKNGCALLFVVHVLFLFWPQFQLMCLFVAHRPSLICARTLPRVRTLPKLLA